MDYLDCELSLQASDSARLRLEDRDFHGRPRLSVDHLTELYEIEEDGQAYGERLFDDLLPPADRLRDGYNEALTLAKERGMRLRFRLYFPPDLSPDLTRLRWERLYDPLRKRALARDPATVFSRCHGHCANVASPTIDTPRLLVAHAAPHDSDVYGLARLDREEMEREFDEGFERQESRIRWEFLPPPITEVRLQNALLEGRFHALHLVGHGLHRREGRAELLLEDDHGASRFLDELQLSEVFLGTDDLRLVTLLSCHGAEGTGHDALSGLAPRLVERGLPAVVSMRDQLRLRAAAEFTRHFYSRLARHGLVDTAVNEARQRLKLVYSDTNEWSDPILFMRLRDGRLWEAPQEPEGPPGEDVPPAEDRRVLPDPIQLPLSKLADQIVIAEIATLGNSNFGAIASQGGKPVAPSQRGKKDGG